MHQATYNNNLTNIARNRINFDMKMIENSATELDKEGIYFSFKKDVIDSVYYKLIVGPADTPYEGGFYFFSCKYPDQYPFHPMRVITQTQGGNVRKHPNLYVCGKCCFSFLGTISFINFEISSCLHI
jgi:ubiquitin-protein ligase